MRKRALRSPALPGPASARPARPPDGDETPRTGNGAGADPVQRVLVADDDATSRELVKIALEHAGFAVDEAKDGAQAVEVFRDRRPDLAILDVRMPRRDGFAACAEIRGQPGGERVPILILTGFEDLNSIRRAYDAGATDFAAKPISPLLLEHRLRYMLRAKRTTDELRESEARLAAAQRMAALGHWERDLRTGAMEWSAETGRLLDLVPGGSRPSLEVYLDRIHPDDRAAARRAAEAAPEGAGEPGIDLRVVRRDGSIRHVHLQGAIETGEDGAPFRITGTLQDITTRKEAESRIRTLAYYDGLTNLPNRALFVERLAVAVSEARRNQQRLAVLFLDLDRFQLVNDTHGHRAGDQLLRDVAERIRKVVRHSDDLARGDAPENHEIAARVGGDEFILWLTGIRRGEDAARAAERVLAALHRPFSIAGEELYVTASAGISLFPDDAEDVEGLLKNADAALHQSKAGGKNGYHFFSPALEETARRRLGLENRLRRAVERGEFMVHFQPQVELATGRVIGAEALARWHPPDLGPVHPAEFIPVAEETGLILSIGEWVIREAVRRARGWRGEGDSGFTIAVNFSARQFRQPHLVESLRQILAEAGFPPERFEVEITEGILLSDREVCLQTLDRLRALGVRICIDDFGTGYSSLNYLARMPVHTLKIDRSFVGEMENPRQAAVTAAIIALGHGLDLKVIAEGVETERQREELARSGCRLAQGFLFGRPVPADRFGIPEGEGEIRPSRLDSPDQK